MVDEVLINEVYCRLNINFTVSRNGAGTSMISTIIYKAIAAIGTANNPNRLFLNAINKQTPINIRNKYKITNTPS